MIGHTKIELTNVKTGETECIEKNNTVTGLLQSITNSIISMYGDSFFRSKDITHSYYSTEEDKNKKYDVFSRFGGLLLFKEIFSSVPDATTEYFPTNSPKMVGHASNEPYSGKDLTRGSFNTNLSKFEPELGKVTLVWDFNLEQGNGTIGTVCLCNHVDGKIGYGSEYEGEENNTDKAPFYHHVCSGYTSPIRYKLSNIINIPESSDKEIVVDNPDCYFSPLWINPDNNEIIWFTDIVHDNKLCFIRTYTGLSNINPLENYFYTSYTEDNKILNSKDMKTEFIEIPIEAHYTAYGDYPLYNDYYECMPFHKPGSLCGLDFKGNFWVSPLYYFNTRTSSYIVDDPEGNKHFLWKVGESKTFTKINLNTMTTTNVTVTNTTDIDFFSVGYSNVTDALSQICIVNNYLFVSGYNHQIYAINLSNNSDVHTVLNVDGTPFLIADGGGYFNEESINRAFGMQLSDAYKSNAAFAVTAYNDCLIINHKHGLTQSSSDGNMYKVNTYDFTAIPIFASSNPCCHDSGNNHQNHPFNRNTGTERVLKNTPKPASVVYSYSSGGERIEFTKTSPTTIEVACGCNLGPVAYDPMKLLTVNTLNQQVTKTADMNMRITYTITLDSPAP